MPKKQAATGAFLRSFEVTAPRSERSDYPLNLAAVRSVDSLALDPRMTIFVGENGSGKSTLVEGLAVAAGFNPEGGSTNFNFRTQDHLPELATHLRQWSWRARGNAIWGKKSARTVFPMRTPGNASSGPLATES